MSPLESRNQTTAGPGYCNTVEVQKKDLQPAFVNMIEVRKEEINKSLKKPMKTQTVGARLFKVLYSQEKPQRLFLRKYFCSVTTVDG